MPDSSDDHNLARDMIDVHGQEAALAGQAEKAKSWIRVLGAIQRQQAGKISATRTLPQ
jgi:hypothetical protein